MSSKISEKEPVLELNKLFYDEEIDKHFKDNIEQKDFKDENFVLITEIQSVLQNCSNLTDKQKLDYCNSQRYFMKLYLKEINKKLLIK